MDKSAHLSPKKRIGGYELKEVIHSGDRSVIYNALEMSTNVMAVGKVIPLSNLKADIVERLKSIPISSKNICQLKLVISDSKNLYLYFEYCNGGNLKSYIEETGSCLSLDDVRYIAIEVAKGLNYLNSMEIVHGDLKMESILLHNKGLKPTVKLSDFGSVLLYENLPLLNSKLSDLSEVKSESQNFSKVDIWLFGHLLLEMVEGKLINPMKETLKVQSRIKLPLLFLDLLRKCLQVDCNNRISWDNLMSHPFLNTLHFAELEYENKHSNTEDGYYCYELSKEEYGNIEPIHSDLSMMIINKMEKLQEELKIAKANLKEAEDKLKAKNNLYEEKLKARDKDRAEDEFAQRNNFSRVQEQIYDDLRLWIINNDGYVGPIELVNITDGVRKVVTTGNIKEDQTLLFIPDELLITLDKAKNECAIAKKAANLSLRHPKSTTFSIWCLEERDKPNTPYATFFRTFLENVSNYPVFYTKSEMDLLKGSALLDMINELREDIKNEYDQVCSIAPEFSKHSLLEFIKMRAIVNNSYFPLDGKGKDEHGLIPYAGNSFSNNRFLSS